MPTIHASRSDSKHGPRQVKAPAPLPPPEAPITTTTTATAAAQTVPHSCTARKVPWLPSRGPTSTPVDVVATPPTQGARDHPLITPDTPRKLPVCPAAPIDSHPSPDACAAAPCSCDATQPERTGSTPMTARELLAELDSMALSPLPPTSVSVPSAHAAAAATATHARPPWHPKPRAGPGTRASRFLEQLRLCTAKLHRISDITPLQIRDQADAACTDGSVSRRVRALQAILARADVELELASDADNTTGSAVWMVVLTEYMCALRIAIASAKVAEASQEHEDGGAADEEAATACAALLSWTAQASRRVFLYAGRTASAVDTAAYARLDRLSENPLGGLGDDQGGALSWRALLMQCGLRVLRLRLLRHVVLVHATGGVDAQHADRGVADEMCAAASALAAELLVLLDSAHALTSTEGVAALDVLSSTWLLAIQSLLEMAFWLPSRTHARLSLLHAAATLLCFWRAHCRHIDCHDDANAPQYSAPPVNNTDHPAPAGESCGDVPPTTVPEFMADLLSRIVTICGCQSNVVAATAAIVTELLLQDNTTTEAGAAMRQRRGAEARPQVACAFVYTSLEDETDLFGAIERSEDARMSLAAFLCPPPDNC